MQQQELSGIIKLAPQAPGVYFFKNERGRVIYIGKAANLRARLRSYAQGGWKDDMVRAAANVEWKELSSDIEALITESSFIKSHKPKYNLVMRDDKNYFFSDLYFFLVSGSFCEYQHTQNIIGSAWI